MCLYPIYFGETPTTPLRYCSEPKVQALLVEMTPQRLKFDLRPPESWRGRILCLNPSSSWCYSTSPAGTSSIAQKCSDTARREHPSFPWSFLCLSHVRLYGLRLHPRSISSPLSSSSCTPWVNLHHGVLPPHYPHRVSDHVHPTGRSSFPSRWQSWRLPPNYLDL